MALKVCFLLFFYSQAFLFIARAQDRAPHGLANESPMAFSPSAVDFFHPKAQAPNSQNPCVASNCAPFPLAAQVESSLAYQSKESVSLKGRNRVGAGGVAAIVFGFAFVVLMGMGAYYVVVTRRTNSSRANSILPDA